MARPAKAKAARALGSEGEIIVTGPRKGRWRAGRLFGAEGVRLNLADLTEVEKAMIAGDPDLIVVEAPPVAPAA